MKHTLVLTTQSSVLIAILSQSVIVLTKQSFVHYCLECAVYAPTYSFNLSSVMDVDGLLIKYKSASFQFPE